VGQKQAAARKAPAKRPRDAGVIRIEITREADWQEKVNLTPRELINEIREVAGDDVANQIGSIRVYQGGDIKITPVTEAVDFQRDLSWVTKWIPSTVPGSLKWKEVVVHGIPQGDSADQNLVWMYEQNGKALQNCLIGASQWIGKINQPGRRAALRIKIENAEKANGLITNGVFLNHVHHRVSRYWKRGPDRGREQGPYFSQPKEVESEEDRMDESDGPLPQETQQPPPLEMGKASQTDSGEPETRKRQRDPSQSGEGEAPKRGRPIGAISLNKFRFEKLKGKDPFTIAKGQPNPTGPELGSPQPAPTPVGTRAQGNQLPSN
jgi:hypothetical protein